MPILWLSQLFSMLSVSATLQQSMDQNLSKLQGMTDPTMTARNDYSAAAAQCLVLADYTKPQRHLVEALFLYCQAKGIVTLDPAGEVCMKGSILSSADSTLLIVMITRRGFCMLS